MKTRNGFVSNSSSSSFMVLMTDEMYKSVRKKMNAFEKGIVDFLEPVSCKFDKKKCVSVGWSCGNADVFECLEDDGSLMEKYEKAVVKDNDDEYDFMDVAFQARDKFVDLAEKEGAFTYSVDV